MLILKNNMRKKDIIIILASVFIFVFIWIGFNIYHNSVKSTISDSVNMQISPISPNFDISVIDKLKKRQSVAPIFQTTGANQVSPGAETPVVTPSLESSGSAAQASPGGSLSQ